MADICVLGILPLLCAKQSHLKAYTEPGYVVLFRQLYPIPRGIA
jgi:hypothetical protein